MTTGSGGFGSIPAHTLVADAEDALAVGDDDELDILRLPTER
jgi:hypothetical protein